MKISKEIEGKHRLRDHMICELYIKGSSAEEIVDALANSTRPIKLSRVYKILSQNAKYINPRIAWPKSKRIQRLQRLADLNPDKLASKKDTIDILEQIRKEVEGEKPLVDLSKHEHITVILDSDAAIQTEQATDSVLDRS